MASIMLFLDTRRKTKTEKYAVRIRIQHRGKSAYISTGVFCKKDNWSKDGVKRGTGNQTKAYINNFLQNFKGKVFRVVLELEAANKLRYATAAQIKQLVLHSEDNVSVFDYWQKHIEQLWEIEKFGSARAYQTALNRFRNFYSGELFFSDFGYSLVRDFDHQLNVDGMSKNGKAVYLRHLRAIYNYAVKEGIAKRENNPFYDFKIESEETRKRNLSIENVRKIISYSGRYELARDYFFFSLMAVGIDVIDVAYLTEDNIVDGRLEYVRKKTANKRGNKWISVKLYPEMQEMIKRRKSGKYLFGIITQEDSKAIYHQALNFRKSVNNRLKPLGEELGIDLKLTSKVSRHTWATLAKKLGYSKELISEMLGHKVQTGAAVTDIYLDEFDRETKDRLQRHIIDYISPNAE